LALIKKINTPSGIDQINVFAFLVLFVFFLNYFLDLSNLLLVIESLLLATLLIILVVRYKNTLLYTLSFIIPLSIPFQSGSAKITLPGELICALFSGFFLIKIFSGYRLPKTFIKHPITLFIFFDMLWLLITSCLSETPQVSFKRLIIRLIYYITFYYFYFELFKLIKKNINRVFLFHCLGMLFPIISATVFHAAFNFSSMGSQLASAPFYNDHTMYGAAIVFFIPFLFMRSCEKSNDLKTKLMFSLLLIIFLMAGFLSYSRAAWLSLIVAVFFGLIFKYRISYKIILPVMLAISIILVLTRVNPFENLKTSKEVSHSTDVGSHFKSISNVSSDASNKERINRWKSALRMFSEKPWFGFGPGTYQFFYGAYQVRKDMTTISTFTGLKGHAHSEYLNYLSETGLPGLIIFLGLIIIVCYKAVKLIKAPNNKYTSQTAMYVFLGLITFFVHAFFNGFIEFDKLAMPVFMSYAVITFLDTQKNKITVASS